MESDLRPLIHAAASNNEGEVKRLLDNGVDVNETDDQGKTALFYAVQNGNETIAVLLIEAGADVDAKDNQGKTALFYAVANKDIEDARNILEVLVEKGDALVNAMDIYDRTPLFYAITNSIPSTRYLLDHEANLSSEDRCNVSIVTYVVEHCLMKQESTANSTFLSEVLSLLLEKGLERQSIAQSILNLVFCKAPLLLCTNEKVTAISGLLEIRTDHILNALKVAGEYAGENVIEKLGEVGEKVRSGEIFEALDLLSKLPNSNPSKADSVGNTALHYTTILPLMGVSQESVLQLCKFLRKKGVHFSNPNHQSQTPLLFCLSANNWKLTSPSNQMTGIKTLVKVCTFLLDKGSKLSETLQNKETVFHLTMKLFQEVFNIHDQVVKDNILQELIKLLKEFEKKVEKQGKVGNNHDDSDNSSLHLWATLALPSFQDYTSNICESYTFEKFLKLILDSLVKCGANVNYRNNEDETPLHLCKTWAAGKLLIEAGANPNNEDSSGCSPLLVATKNSFYSDVAVPKDPTACDSTHLKRQTEVNEQLVTPDSSNHSCLSKAENSSRVEDQSSKLAKKSVWCPVSKTHKEKLKKVSVRQECNRIQTICYHKDYIGGGAFGFVFVGINEKDGREVAIKRIQNYKVNEEEMKNLTRLADCEQVVRYLYYFNGDDFTYMISELMEGTLDEYLEGDIDESKSVQLCKDVVMGLRFLHCQSIPIIHRDLKPANILFKTCPQLCLKIADFGQSVLIDKSCDKDKVKPAGTRCWKAPEVFNDLDSHTGLVSADMFSCGLLLHYMLSRGKHPFCPDGCSYKSKSQDRALIIKIEANMREDRQEGWDTALSPEATHLVKKMLENNEKNRPNAEDALVHPLFWAKDEKIDLLLAVGNQPEFACSQDAYSSTSNTVQKVLGETVSVVVKHGSWNNPTYTHMSAIYEEMQVEGKSYDTGSVIDLVRFIRCAYMRFSDKTCSALIKTCLHQDFVFLEYFPDLVMEVYKAVTTHCWDQTREAIKKLIPDNNNLGSQNLSSMSPYRSKVHCDKLTKVTRGEDYDEVNQYSYHKDPIATGKFGEIFAGINSKDGREVAIKRIDKMRIQKPEDKREIRNLTLLADCRHVVLYLFFFETENFSYVILELMEGNLEELLNEEFDGNKRILLCKDVVTGVKYLHEFDILHRDLKPSNILYKCYPKLCLKLADFGLSRRIDSTSTISVCGSNVGTKCWIAPEVLNSPCSHSKSSDNFSCGLVTFYILSMKRHPFSPVHCDNQKTSYEETEANLLKGEVKGWDDSLTPEATHLLKNMLDGDVNERPSAEEALEHPLFWSKKKKVDLLKYVGSQPEFKCPRSKRTHPLTPVETDLEKSFSNIIRYASWNDLGYEHMPDIYDEMTRKRPYATNSIVELVRFIRNAYENVSDETRPTAFRRLLLEDFVFLEYFPDLVMEVYKAVKTHGWDQTKEEVPRKTIDHEKLFTEEAPNRSFSDLSKEPVSLLPLPKEIDSIPIRIPWTSVSHKHQGILAKVARRQECEIVDHIWFHKNHIGSGFFGHIFAGINEKDGREVAIKRIEKLRIQRQAKREISSLTALADCQHVVRYLSFFEDEHFSYIVLELMEGNLEKYLNAALFDATQATLLCKDVVMGLKFLHELKILHCDLKPQNILYKVHPRLCLKIADFGLSRRIDQNTTTVYNTNAGTRCWMAPEMLESIKDISMSSDMFSCGLILHYIFSGQKHPFRPTHWASAHETETNILIGNMTGWDDSLSPEATHLVRSMLEINDKDRPSARQALEHPLFWTGCKKIDLLAAVGNQPEFEYRRSKRTHPLTPFETDLERSFGMVIKYKSWNDPGYEHMPAIYNEMARKRKYDTFSIVELVRFIRNVYAHTMDARSTAFRRFFFEDFVFLKYFPNLVMEVYKTVTTHGWDQTREEIKYAICKT